MFFLDHIVNEKPFLDEKHCLNTVKSVATIKKLAAMSSFVVWTTNCCVVIMQITVLLLKYPIVVMVMFDGHIY